MPANAATQTGSPLEAGKPFVVPPLSALPGPEVDRNSIESEVLARAKDGAEQHRKADAVFTFRDKSGKPLAGVPVEVRQTGHEFLFGNCATFDLCRQGPDCLRPLFHPIPKPAWEERFLKLFNFGILPFYWSGYEPSPGQPQQESMEEALDWFKQHGITAKGHPLMWPHHPSGAPEWLRAAQRVETDMLTGENKVVVTDSTPKVDPGKAGQLQIKRITREVSHFNGRIDVWDVYNEAAWATGADAPKLASTIDPAFRAAREANPKARLILNDAGMYADTARREGLYNLVAELKKRGTPLDAVGFQSHIGDWWMPERVVQTLDLFARLGYAIHITEFIPTSNGTPIQGGWRTGTWTREAQAEFAEYYYRIWFGHPAVASITWWGLTDRHVWLPQGGLIDEDYNPKPVYERLDALINREWKTNLELKTDEQGQVKFRGFCGDYSLSLSLPGGQRIDWQAKVAKSGVNKYSFTLE